MSVHTDLQYSRPSSVEAESLTSTSERSSCTSNSTSASSSPGPKQRLKSDGTNPQYGVLLDTYGNEFKIPDFTIKQIRDAIPSHCFERSALQGYSYVARDLLLLATTFYLFHNYVTPETVPSSSTRFVLWSIYGFVQGLFGTGIWVLAHECGHQSFSTSKIINDTTGWVLHSALLVPYFSWKISHGKHHKSTGHMERDMVFLPKTREVYAGRVRKAVHEISELAEETPIMTALILVGRQLIGWPLYLIQNKTGHDNHERQSEGRGIGKRNVLGGGVNHFSPSSPLFDAKDAKLVVLSDIGLGITASVLYYIGSTYGWNNLFVWYFLPYLWVNHWLGITSHTHSHLIQDRLLTKFSVAITYLQHTDPTVAHYGPETWSFTRGAAATVDREFGFIGRQLFHGIIETHVLHHYVSTIPFYNADEATEAIKPVMGVHYLSNTRNGPIGFLQSLWRSSRWCQWVEPSDGAKGAGKDVVFYRNRNGLGVKPIKMDPL
jgi:omega-6 fatty acid desaturase (delta-12 desaturase)